MKKIKKLRIIIWSINITLLGLLALIIIYTMMQNDNRTTDRVTTTPSAHETVQNKTEPKQTKKPSEQPVVEEKPIETPVKKGATLAFAGDICLQTATIAAYDQGGLDGLIAKELVERMKNADLAMANQEFTFSNRGEAMKDKQYTFRANPSYVTVFQQLGLDVVTLANNHALDFGIEALKDSFTTLEGADISYVGAGETLNRAKQIEYKEVNGIKFAFIGASRVIPVVDWNATSKKPGMMTTYDPTLALEQIKLAEETADYTIIYVHWGLERKDFPEKYQKTMARQYIDAGADFVVGSHSHCMQGIEFYKEKPIVYSLGNFIFNRTIKQTSLLEVSLDEQLNPTLKLIPCYAKDAYTDLVRDSKKAEQFYRHMTDISFGVEVDEEGKIINKNKNL